MIRSICARSRFPSPSSSNLPFVKLLRARRTHSTENTFFLCKQRSQRGQRQRHAGDGLPHPSPCIRPFSFLRIIKQRVLATVRHHHFNGSFSGLRVFQNVTTNKRRHSKIGDCETTSFQQDFFGASRFSTMSRCK